MMILNNKLNCMRQCLHCIVHFFFTVFEYMNFERLDTCLNFSFVSMWFHVNKV